MQPMMKTTVSGDCSFFIAKLYTHAMNKDDPYVRFQEDGSIRVVNKDAIPGSDLCPKAKDFGGFQRQLNLYDFYTEGNLVWRHKDFKMNCDYSKIKRRQAGDLPPGKKRRLHSGAISTKSMHTSHSNNTVPKVGTTTQKQIKKSTEAEIEEIEPITAVSSMPPPKSRASGENHNYSVVCSCGCGYKLDFVSLISRRVENDQHEKTALAASTNSPTSIIRDIEVLENQYQSRRNVYTSERTEHGGGAKHRLMNRAINSK